MRLRSKEGIKMKKALAAILAGIMLLCCVACGKTEVPEINPDEGKIKSICQLSVMECYYHNVAKVNELNAEKLLWITKNRHFWVEYTGVVTFGIDASKVKMEVSGKEITLTMPKAEVLKYKIESNSLDQNSYIVDKDSAKVTHEHITAALSDAQEKLKKQAESDDTLLSMAQNRAKELLEAYVKNLAMASGNAENEYTINWVYLDD